MTVSDFINRGYHLPLLKSSMVPLKSYPVTPFSSLTARSDHAVNDRFKEEPNEYTPEEMRFIEELLAGMSNSAERVARAPANARMRFPD